MPCHASSPFTLLSPQTCIPPPRLPCHPLALVPCSVPSDCPRRSRHNSGRCAVQRFGAEAMAFQERVIVRSGLGDETYVPASAPSPPCHIGPARLCAPALPMQATLPHLLGSALCILNPGTARGGDSRSGWDRPCRSNVFVTLPRSHTGQWLTPIQRRAVEYTPTWVYEALPLLSVSLF